MKKTIAFALILSMAVGCCGIASASAWADDYLAYLTLIQPYSYYNSVSSELSTALTFCNDKLIFMVVSDSSALNRDITQIFFIAEGNTVNLKFAVDDDQFYYLTLSNIDGTYSYHTLYKDEVPLMQALAAARSVTISYTTANRTEEYQLTQTELENVNALFEFYVSHEFWTAVSSEYVDVCIANSTLFPMRVETTGASAGSSQPEPDAEASAADDDLFGAALQNMLGAAGAATGLLVGAQ